MLIMIAKILHERDLRIDKPKRDKLDQQRRAFSIFGPAAQRVGGGVTVF